MKLVIDGTKLQTQNTDYPLIRLIAKAHLLKTELETGIINSIKEFAENHHIDHGDAKNLVPLCYLAPSIVEDVLAGHQPSDLTISHLKSVANNLPINWSEQRQVLGFS